MLDRLFNSRIERRVTLLLLAGTALPIIALSIYAIWQLQMQTLDSTEVQLKALAKNYGQQIVERLRFAQTELEQRVQLDLSSSAPSAVSTTIGMEGEKPVNLVVKPYFKPLKDGQLSLRIAKDSLRLETPLNDGFAVGMIPISAIFHDITDLQDGLYRCVDIGPRPESCSASWPVDWVATNWTLYLHGVLGADFDVTIWMAMPEGEILSGITLAAQILPAVILLVAALACWLILKQLRTQLSPLHRLRKGASAIASGDYDYRVEINTGDEFERLAGAFNDMAMNVGSSIQTLSALSSIDQLILSGANLERVLIEALKLSQAVSKDSVQVLLEDPFDQSLFLASLEDSTFIRTPQENSLDSQLARCPANQRDFMLVMEERPVGALRVTDKLNSLQVGRLDDLAHRLSVAITNIKRSANLYEQANFDGLTGLLNRQALISRLDDSIHVAKRNDHQLALLYLDLDRFKNVNDSEGHAVGDSLLQLVADRLRNQSREVDAIARLGGDEFAIIIADVKDQNAVTAVCRRLISVLSDQVILHRIEHTVQTSLGIAIYPQDGLESTTLMRNADTAMYKAKSHGGGGYAFFDPSLHATAERKVVMQAALRRAIGTSDVYCEFQPKLHLATGRFLGAEALMRWHDAELGRVRPDEFIPLAEETGLIHDLTDVIFREAKKFFSTIAGASTDFRLAINLSPRQLAIPEFGAEIIERIKSFGLSPDQLELELTESSFVQDADSLVANINSLRQAGFTIAMDDFGTGYSSLTLLKTLPLDTLKLDREFIKDITDDTKSRKLVGHLIEIAKFLELSVVAEGAESELELELLRELGCDYVQGYVVARPLSITDFAEIISSASSHFIPNDNVVNVVPGPIASLNGKRA